MAIETNDRDNIEKPRAIRLLLTMLAAIVAGLMISLSLPSSPYIRYQQSAGTILFHSKWIYERIHDDPTPIDVAVIGTSRFEAGVSPVELQRQLSAKTGHPIHVANLALLKLGRNLHYSIVKDLLKTHPETKMIVLSVDEEHVASHDLFRYVAEDADLLTSPIIINRYYFDDLFFLPYRHLSYFCQTLFPGAFGIDSRFQPASYLGTDLDRSAGYISPTGKPKNGIQSAPPQKLRAEATEVLASHQAMFKFPWLLGTERQMVIERDFTHRIVTLAHEHGVRVVFLHIPPFEGQNTVQNPEAYSSQGDYLDMWRIADDPSMYADGAHLNRAGALVLTDWLADKIAPLLRATELQSGGLQSGDTR